MKRNAKKNTCLSNKKTFCQIMFLNIQELSAVNTISVVFSSLGIESFF